MNGEKTAAAVKTPLGWAIVGELLKPQSNSMEASVLQTSHKNHHQQKDGAAKSSPRRKEQKYFHPNHSQRVSPGVSKQYRDSLRNSQQHWRQQSNATPKIAPSSTKQKCAWCTENFRRHSHSTHECRLFEHANDNSRKWHVLKKNRICSRCLEHDYSKACSKKNMATCRTCNTAHSEKLRCPSDGIRLYQT